jgi:GMP synthase-like glutamine amidotransferase
MPVLVIQNDTIEDAGAIRVALDARGLDVVVVEAFSGEPVPTSAACIDALVVLGGRMSAYSDVGFPSRVRQLALLRDGLSRGIPLLGVCLGAQLLAVAGGGTAEPGYVGEFGWGPIHFSGATCGDELLSGLPTPLQVVHWHRDTFTLPPSAVGLASSGAYVNQAFSLGRTAWGLQFHIEFTDTAIAALASTLRDPHDRLAVLDATQQYMTTLREVQGRVCGRFADLVASREKVLVSSNR